MQCLLCDTAIKSSDLIMTHFLRNMLKFVFSTAPQKIQLNYFDKICFTEHVSFFYFEYCVLSFLSENVPFKRIKINNISYDIPISYEGPFVNVSIK